jgi:hypothetical protein
LPFISKSEDEMTQIVAFGEGDRFFTRLEQQEKLQTRIPAPI